jgi:hypothetical protein
MFQGKKNIKKYKKTQEMHVQLLIHTFLRPKNIQKNLKKHKKGMYNFSYSTCVSGAKEYK